MSLESSWDPRKIPRELPAPPGGNEQELPSNAQIEALGEFMRASFIGTVAIILAGILPLGQDGREALRQWGQDRIEDARIAYLAALGAQDSANYANAILGSSLQTNVDGGVQISESFNGPAAPTPGTNWTNLPDGGGAGTYGPNGLGKSTWTKSGGGSRIQNFRHVTETTGDDQAVQLLLSTLPQASGTDQPPYNYIRGRVSEDQQSFVYARIGRSSLQLGCFTDGVQHVFDTELGMDNKPGQVWKLQCGTDDGVLPNPREFVVYRNNLEKMRDTDGGNSNLGADYRGVGYSAEARSRVFATDQSIPGDIDVFAAADFTAA